MSERTRGIRRRSAWAAPTALLVVVGAAASLLGAQAVARNDGEKSRAAFKTSTAEIASKLKLAIQHEDDLVVSGSAFVASDPYASQTEFTRWARSVRALERYPELQTMGEVAVVPASKLKAFAKRIVVDPPRPLPADGTYRVVPAGERPFYCLSATAHARLAEHLPVGFDYCSKGSKLRARDSGQGSYTPYKVGDSMLLVVQTPIYRGGIVPTTLAARRAAFIGYLAVSVLPKYVLDTALGGHPATALELRFHTASSHAVFSAGKAPAGAHSATVDLQNGWTMRTFAAVSGDGVFDDRNALLLLIGGLGLSLLLGAFTKLLTRINRQLARQASQSAHDALHDALTGLPNRVLFSDRLEHLIAAARRDPRPLRQPAPHRQRLTVLRNGTTARCRVCAAD